VRSDVFELFIFFEWVWSVGKNIKASERRTTFFAEVKLGKKGHAQISFKIF
jgi:hypothetical protein